MDKYSLLENTINLHKFSLTDEEFQEYKRLIKSTLAELYPHLLANVPGMGEFLLALNRDKSEGRDFSILGITRTNISVLLWMVREFKLNSFDEIKSFIHENKSHLFREDGKYYNELRAILLSTERQGILNEDFAITYIKNIVKHNIGVDITPVRTPPMSKEDMMEGIDIKFDIDGKTYTCQVKPLVNYTQDINTTVIISKGLIKKYNTSYLAFVSREKNKVILIRNNKEAQSQITLNGYEVKVPNKFIVEIKQSISSIAPEI